MKKMNAFVIDDEKPARELIKNYLIDFPEIEVTGEFTNGFDAAKAIQTSKPDIIFLDIQMPKLTGVEMLEIIPEPRPAIIFTTAYDEYAIKAFELSAVDYLLKPISQERFKEALQKLKAGSAKKNSDKLIEANDGLTPGISRIVVNKGSSIHILLPNDIEYIQAEDDYVMIYTKDHHYLKQKPMKYYETHLPLNEFVRIHRSYIVNVNKIQSVERYAKESFIAILQNKSRLKISRQGYKNLKEVLHL